MKTLKFAKDLVPLIKSGKKTTTWRLFDDKDLQKGDEIQLISRPDLNVFAIAKIIEMTEKPFHDLTDIDLEGHEQVGIKQQMYDTYTMYYKQPVDEHTLVKIIKFKILRFL